MKTIFLAAALALMPMVALAAPTGWKPAADCTIPPDHAIWSDDNSHVTGCITAEAWAAVMTVNVGDQNKLQAFIFPSGTTKVGSNGVLYTCPWWFGMFSCILPPGAR